MKSKSARRIVRVILSVWALVPSFSAVLQAQDQLPPVTTANEPSELASLGLSELETIAIEHNPTLDQAAAAVERARGLCLQAGLYPNPTVGYTAGEIGNEGRAGQQGAFVAQEFVTAGKLGLDQSVARHRLEQAEARYEAQRLRIVGAVRTSYFRALAAQRAVEIVEELQGIAGRALSVANDLLEAGEGTRSDVLLAEIETAKSRILLSNTRSRLKAAWRNLSTVVGLPSLAQTRLAGRLDGELPELVWESAWETLRRQSPEIQAALIGVPRALDSLRRAEVEPIPNVRLQAMVQYDAATRDTISGLQVGVPLPIFNRNEGNIQAAHSDVHRAQREVDRVELELRRRLAQAFQRYETARQQVEAYTDQILPKANESLELSREGYRRQEFDFLQVLTAQRTYFETHLAYVTSLAELQTSAVAIESMLLIDGLSETTLD